MSGLAPARGEGASPGAAMAAVAAVPASAALTVSTVPEAGAPPLRLLLSAYACEPGRGSEPGVGWRWALEMARLGHRVWVLTRANNRAVIAAAGPLPPNLRFLYCDLPRWAGWWKRGGRGVHLYYLLWQWRALAVARQAHRSLRFDAVQHLTFGVTRQPSFLGRLGIPLILGPLGGGERVPRALRRHYSLRGRLTDAVRDLANGVARFDPNVRAMLSRARIILVKTPETLAWLPAAARDRAGCMLEIGIDLPDAGAGGGAAPRPGPPPAGLDAPAPRPLRLLYVGRFLALKGIGLALPALGRLANSGVDWSLTLIGQGPEEARWRALAARLGIAARLDWRPWQPQAALAASYAGHDALLFPSLRDSSGNVVLEALAHGLPVVCLGLGGPACLVDAHCGRVVPVSGRGETEVIDGLAGALHGLAREPGLLAQLGAGARRRAARYTWASVVGRVWGPGGSACRLVERERACVS